MSLLLLLFWETKTSVKILPKKLCLLSQTSYYMLLFTTDTASKQLRRK